jgi:hypothetical protein
VKVGASAVGVLVVLVGAVFAGQGLGYIAGSFMTGDIHWFWIGGAMVIAGLALLSITLRRRPKRT